MRLPLERFQADAAATVAQRLRRARRDHAEDGELTAVGLTAPTGAGKTVIATAVLEDLLFGTATTEPDPDLTVLWVTDDPSLNRQTIDKIVGASDRIDHTRVRFLGEDDAPTLEPGYLYFVHIQQLQRNSTLHAFRDGQRSDHRTHGAWEMIAATVERRGADLLVVVDEAHRGARAARDRSTIVGTIVNGGTTNIGTSHPAAPVVLGISATPERFEEAMRDADRSLKRVSVAPADVRESGLLKDRIVIMPVAEDQSAAHTMLTLAVADLRAYTAAWAAHHREHRGRLVEPILVVQVEPGASEEVLDAYLATIESAWSELSGYAVAHAFGDPHGPLSVGDRAVRYLRPDAIERDDQVRVVLFKSALTTGWDCPRAEVLVSFQNRDSYTEIAQLIGRLVRTPLAARALGDELLDSVMAYLPGFRLEHVTRVVAALTSDQVVETEVVVDPVTCVRRDLSAAVAALEGLTTFRRDSAPAPSRTAQLLRLAHALAVAGIVPRASTVARETIVDELLKQRRLHEGEVDAKVADLLSVDLGVVDVHLGAEIMQSSTTRTAPVSERDLDASFERAARRLPDGAATWLYRRLCDDLPDPEAKAAVAAMAALDFAQHAEDEALATIRLWRSSHADRVSLLPRSEREHVQALWNVDAVGIVPTTMSLPPSRREATTRVDAGRQVDVPTWPHHLYVVGAGEHAGRFPVAVTSWEQAVLERELDDDRASTLVTWYRNPPSGGHALAVPYAWGSGTALTHPDFLFVHERDGAVVVDIVDPHRHDDSASGARWAGIALHARDYGDGLGRVVAVIRDAAGRMRGLDLRAEGREEQLLRATDQQKIEALFDEDGFDYA